MTTFSGAIGTRTGDRHTAHGTFNQDYACYALLPNDMGIVAAVSDGAGSAPMARTGSRTSAQHAAAKAWRQPSGSATPRIPPSASTKASKQPERLWRPQREYRAILSTITTPPSSSPL